MTIRIDQPRPFDLVGNPILVGGVGTGFEATLHYRVHEGHDEVIGFFMVGGGTGEHGQYQLQVDVSGAAFTLDRVFVEVFEISPRTARRSTRSSSQWSSARGSWPATSATGST